MGVVFVVLLRVRNVKDVYSCILFYITASDESLLFNNLTEQKPQFSLRLKKLNDDESSEVVFFF